MQDEREPLMSTSLEPQKAPEGLLDPMGKKEAKAQAAAAAAYAKSQKSWPARHKILTGLGALVVAVVGISVAQAGGSDTPSTTTSDTAAVAPAPDKAAPDAKTAGLNTPVRDGKFEFTVNSVKCGVESVGPEGFEEKAQGQFCLVKMNVSNIGDEAQMLDGSSQIAFDAAGKKFSTSTSAAIMLDDADTFLNEINPGNAVDGTVVFDVPKTVKVVKLELHDSPFSDGVEVKVG